MPFVLLLSVTYLALVFELKILPLLLTPHLMESGK